MAYLAPSCSRVMVVVVRNSVQRPGQGECESKWDGSTRTLTSGTVWERRELSICAYVVGFLLLYRGSRSNSGPIASTRLAVVEDVACHMELLKIHRTSYMPSVRCPF